MCLLLRNTALDPISRKEAVWCLQANVVFSSLSGHSCYSSVVTWVWWFFFVVVVFKQAAYKRLRVSHIPNYPSWLVYLSFLRSRLLGCLGLRFVASSLHKCLPFSAMRRLTKGKHQIFIRFVGRKLRSLGKVRKPRPHDGAASQSMLPKVVSLVVNVFFWITSFLFLF